jgi:hypothetical protein
LTWDYVLEYGDPLLNVELGLVLEKDDPLLTLDE